MKLPNKKTPAGAGRGAENANLGGMQSHSNSNHAATLPRHCTGCGLLLKSGRHGLCGQCEAGSQVCAAAKAWLASRRPPQKRHYRDAADLREQLRLLYGGAK